MGGPCHLIAVPKTLNAIYARIAKSGSVTDHRKAFRPPRHRIGRLHRHTLLPACETHTQGVSPVPMNRIFDIADRLRLSERFHGATRSVLARA